MRFREARGILFMLTLVCAAQAVALFQGCGGPGQNTARMAEVRV